MNYKQQFTNKKLKKIINVYQLNYINGRSNGFGDFLRGSFCLMQLAQLLNLKFDIDFSNHPLSKYIENSEIKSELDYNNLEIFNNLNCKNGCHNYEHTLININEDFLNHIIKYLNSQDVEVVGFYSNSYPIFNKHSEEGKNFIKSKIRPKQIMINYINRTLNTLNLTRKNYGVIHIRTGDKYLVNGDDLNYTFINKIKNILANIILPNKRYLILSDSNILKQNLKDIPNFYVLIRKIEHLGGDTNENKNDNGILNTMCDFYLMGECNSIMSLSVYAQVSGFSKYCSIIHNIPFKFIKIES